jgi:pimeloyl-ACP methyl ester carboxylesterase
VAEEALDPRLLGRGSVLAALMEPTPDDREGAIESTVRTQRILGSPGFPFDESAARAYAARAYDRGTCLEGRVRQMMAMAASPDLTERLTSLHKPAAVIHGEDDPLSPLEDGQLTAKTIPGAVLTTIPGMGHDLPEGAWPTVLGAVVSNAQRAYETA